MSKLFYILSILSIILLIGSFFSDYWSVKKIEDKDKDDTNVSDVESTLGLWRLCFDAKNKGNYNREYNMNFCSHLPPDNNDILVNFPKNSLYAIRILCLTGIVLIIWGFIRARNMDPAGDHRPCVALLSIGAVLYLSGIFVWHNQFTTVRFNERQSRSKIKFRLGSAVHTGIIGSVLAIIASISLYRS